MPDRLFQSFTTGKGPERQTVDLDPTTQQMINDTVNRASSDPSQFAARANAGVGEAGQQAFQSPEQMAQQSAGMGEYNQEAMGTAIQNKYRQLAGKDIGHITRTNDINSLMMKGNALHRAAGMALAQQQVRTQNFEALTQAYNDNQMARAQVIKGILGRGGEAYAQLSNNNRGGSGAGNSQPQMGAGGGYGGSQGGVMEQQGGMDSNQSTFDSRVPF